MTRMMTVAAILAAAVLPVSAPAFAQDAAPEAPAADAAPEAPAVTVTVETLTPGEGDPPPAGSFVLVNYKGMLEDGTVFDQADRVPLDLNNVVPGFAQGLVQMQRGGRYRLTIPPELGYGAQASGPIPANSRLVFEIDLIDYKTPEEIRQMMLEIRAQQEAAAKARIDAAQAEAKEKEPK